MVSKRTCTCTGGGHHHHHSKLLRSCANHVRCVGGRPVLRNFSLDRQTAVHTQTTLLHKDAENAEKRLHTGAQMFGVALGCSSLLPAPRVYLGENRNYNQVSPPRPLDFTRRRASRILSRFSPSPPQPETIVGNASNYVQPESTL